MLTIYRAKINIAAEIGRPAQAFTLTLRSTNPAKAERRARQWALDRNWQQQPLESSVAVQVEEVQS